MEVLAVAVAVMVTVTFVVAVVGTRTTPRWVRRLPPEQRLRWDDRIETWVPAELPHSVEQVTSFQ